MSGASLIFDVPIFVPHSREYIMRLRLVLLLHACVSLIIQHGIRGSGIVAPGDYYHLSVYECCSAWISFGRRTL